MSFDHYVPKVISLLYLPTLNNAEFNKTDNSEVK